MLDEASALGPGEGGGGRAPRSTGPSAPSDPHLPVPPHPSSSSLNLSVSQVPLDQFSAFELSLNNGSNVNLQSQDHRSRLNKDDAIYPDKNTQSCSDNHLKDSRLSHIIDCVQSRITGIETDNTRVTENAPTPMDIDSSKTARKRSSNEALSQTLGHAAHKSRKPCESNTLYNLSAPASQENDINGTNASHIPTTVTPLNGPVDNQPNRPAREPTSYKYSAECSALFVVYIYSKNISGPDAAHPLMVSKLISNIAFNDIIELKKSNGVNLWLNLSLTRRLMPLSLPLCLTLIT